MNKKAIYKTIWTIRCCQKLHSAWYISVRWNEKAYKRKCRVCVRATSGSCDTGDSYCSSGFFVVPNLSTSTVTQSGHLFVSPIELHLPLLIAPLHFLHGRLKMRSKMVGDEEEKKVKCGKPASGINSPLEQPSPSSLGPSPWVARTAHKRDHKAPLLPPSPAAPGNLNPIMPHPSHELQDLLAPNCLPEQTDIPESWRRGEELHQEPFFSRSHFSAFLENVATPTVHYHWCRAIW